ncbi:DinB family protein [Nocardia camponoti]
MIVPDTKNWTWVLDRACDDCGYSGATTSFASVPALTVDSANRIAATLTRPDVRVRPDDATWSTLEYAAHVRDVCRIFTRRLALTLASGDEVARFENWDQDATAIEDRYNEQDPETVRAELVEAAETVSKAFANVTPEQLSLEAERSDGSRFTVDSLGRYFVHDLVHHVNDVHG